MKTMDDLFYALMQDVYYAEKQQLKSLKKMGKKASSDELQTAFNDHMEETQEQIERLDQAFEMFGKKARGKKCDAILGIIAEGDEVIEEAEEDDILDAGLIGAAQAAEHYEIARYGTLKTWVGELGLARAVELLDETLAEEKATDTALTELAEAAVNQRAEAA